MFEEVVKPLLSEVKIKDETIEKLKTEINSNSHDVKLLNACIRMPAMCD